MEKSITCWEIHFTPKVTTHHLLALAHVCRIACLHSTPLDSPVFTKISYASSRWLSITERHAFLFVLWLRGSNTAYNSKQSFPPPLAADGMQSPKSPRPTQEEPEGIQHQNRQSTQIWHPDNNQVWGRHGSSLPPVLIPGWHMKCDVVVHLLRCDQDKEVYMRNSRPDRLAQSCSKRADMCWNSCLLHGFGMRSTREENEKRMCSRADDCTLL